MAAVRVVTDSTASFVRGRAERAGIITVPLQVVLDKVTAAETVDGADDASGGARITGAEVAEALRAGRAVTTSRPPPEAFAAAYRLAADDGADAVVSVHLSGAISSTYDAAVAAARSAPVPVTVVDSRTVGMALGFAALAGAALAAEGMAAVPVADAVTRRAAGSSAFFSVDSLEYLRRGGRIGTAQALIGSALAVKPLLTVADGSIRSLERVRTRAKAVARLEQLGVEVAERNARAEPTDVGVHHLDDPHGADEVAGRLAARLGAAGVVVGALEVSEISAVLGVHAGPGMLGVIISPRSARPAGPHPRG